MYVRPTGVAEEVAMFGIRRPLGALSALALACTAAILPAGPPAGATGVAPASGYWLAGSDGGVFSFGAPFAGSGVAPSLDCSFSPQPPSTADSADGCVGIASTPEGAGYWLVNAYRLASGLGASVSPSATGCTSLNGATGAWVGAASTTDGKGYFLASSNGAVLGCGDAEPLGGVAGRTLAAPIVGIASTPDGGGYWLVGADGGVFAFGDAAFDGSLGGTRLDAPVVGIATYGTSGYWLVAADGGVFAFGHAPFEGSMGGQHLNAPVVGISADSVTSGYWLAAADGGVFAFDAPFEGSMAGKPLAAPITGIAPYRQDVAVS